jgi:hypothetical protein
MVIRGTIVLATRGELVFLARESDGAFARLRIAFGFRDGKARLLAALVHQLFGRYGRNFRRCQFARGVLCGE